LPALVTNAILKAVIFDLDGTMVDNMMVHHKAWQKKLGELGLHMGLDEVIQNVHGINEEILERLFGERYNPGERTQLSNEKEAAYREIFLPQLKLVDGLNELLTDLKSKNIPMGIGSAAPEVNVDFVVDNLNIRHWFKLILSSKDVQKGKPDPEVYLKVARQLGVPATSCLIFEDSPIGAEAVERAGAKSIIITTTHRKEEFENIQGILAFISDYSHLTFNSLNHMLNGVS
jgi:HAD superfamily hydrolase (TIGR01509 family)